MREGMGLFQSNRSLWVIEGIFKQNVDLMRLYLYPDFQTSSLDDSPAFLSQWTVNHSPVALPEIQALFLPSYIPSVPALVPGSHRCYFPSFLQPLCPCFGSVLPLASITSTSCL